MLNNFFKITIRNFLKHKAYSAISVVGLVIGFSAFLFISLFVQYETSWDKQNEKYNRIYRVQRQFTNAIHALDGNDISPHTRGLTAKLLEERYPEFEKILIIRENGGRFLSSTPARSFYDEYGICADQPIFDIFSYRFIEGTQAIALTEPFSIVLSKKLADKLFPGASAVGKTMLIEKKYNLKVTGVFNDLPQNSIVRPSYIISLSSLEKTDDVRNSRSGIYMTYVLLKEGQDYKAVNRKIGNIFKDFQGIEDEKVFLCPLSKVYLSFNDQDDYLIILFLFRMIGIFLLLLASFNYINLTTANSAIRTREIAVRKVHGSNQSMLLGQFLGESVIIALLATGISFVLTENLLPLFGRIVHKELVFSYTGNWPFIVKMVCIAISVGFLSGLYPAWFMSSQKITSLFSGSIYRGKRERFGLKKLLVTFQFSISMLLIILCLFFAMQIYYMMHLNLGFDKENLLITKFESSRQDANFEDLRNRVLQHPEITNASASWDIPFVSFGGRTINWEGALPNEKVNIRYNHVSYDFIQNFGMTILEGRDFSRDFPSDTGVSCIINETAWKNFGWDDPIGKRLNNNKWVVVGVVKDYFLKDMYNAIEPCVLMLQNDSLKGNWSFAFRVQSGSMQAARKMLTSEMESYFTNDPFEIQSFTEAFEHEHTFDTFDSINNTTIFFTVLNILLAVIGLLGLVSFTNQRRTKEIGIRKIHGSSSISMFLLLNWEYLTILFFSSLITWPAAYAMYEYLPGSNKVPLQGWVFPFASGIVLIIILFSTSYQTLKAAATNPVEALRYE